MIGTTQVSAYEFPRPMQGRRDVTWYGTLGVLAASLGVMFAAFFGG